MWTNITTIFTNLLFTTTRVTYKKWQNNTSNAIVFKFFEKQSIFSLIWMMALRRLIVLLDHTVLLLDVGEAEAGRATVFLHNQLIPSLLQVILEKGFIIGVSWNYTIQYIFLKRNISTFPRIPFTIPHNFCDRNAFS